TEGWAMLSAVLDDFSQVSNAEVLTLLDRHFEHDYRNGTCLCIQAQDEEKAFRRLAKAADFTLVIAPELGGILERRCGWVMDSGGQLLGPPLAGVQLTADKLALSRYLRDRGVPTPESQLFLAGQEEPKTPFPAVWKPRFGAGSQETFLVHDWEQL